NSRLARHGVVLATFGDVLFDLLGIDARCLLPALALIARHAELSELRGGPGNPGVMPPGFFGGAASLVLFAVFQEFSQPPSGLYLDGASINSGRLSALQPD